MLQSSLSSHSPQQCHNRLSHGQLSNKHGASHLGSRLILPVKVSVKQTESAEQAACTCDRMRLQVIQAALSQDAEPQRGASY